ncbi:MAG TPA: tetratricopeptide repeat protein [Bacilli bacterium]|nr:tetratricopeptide repeat protein [Bacilli bacterium]
MKNTTATILRLAREKACLTQEQAAQVVDTVVADIAALETDGVSDWTVSGWVVPRLLVEAYRMTQEEIAGMDASIAYFARFLREPFATGGEILAEGEALMSASKEGSRAHLFAVRGLIRAYANDRQFEKAMRLASDALDRYNELDGRGEDMTDILLDIGNAHTQRGDFLLALTEYERAIDCILKHHGKTLDHDDADEDERNTFASWQKQLSSQLARAYSSALIAAAKVGDTERVKDYADKCRVLLEFSDFSRKDWYLTTIEYSIASAARLREDYETAAEHYEAARQGYEKAGRHIEAARMLGNVGEMLMEMGRLTDAEKALDESRRLKVEYGESEAYLLSTDVTLARLLFKLATNHDGDHAGYDAAATLAKAVYANPAALAETRLEAAELLAEMSDDIAMIRRACATAATLEQTPANTAMVWRLLKKIGGDAANVNRH